MKQAYIQTTRSPTIAVYRKGPWKMRTRRADPHRDSGGGCYIEDGGEKEAIMNAKPILDACCGSKMFWFDKNNPAVEFCDNREVPYHEYYPNRYIEIKPDTVCDFTALPFPDKSFKLVVFDPPHLTWAGPKSWMALKYGCLDGNWPQMIHDGFWECMRVLDDYGTLIFKWSEVQIPLRHVLDAIKAKPLFGNRSGKSAKTHWMCFMKGVSDEH